MKPPLWRCSNSTIQMLLLPLVTFWNPTWLPKFVAYPKTENLLGMDNLMVVKKSKLKKRIADNETIRSFKIIFLT